MSGENVCQLQGDDGVLRGVVHLTDGEPAAHAAILHGYFSSNRIGPSRLYVSIARALARCGIQVWRFDCRGFGDSDGEFEQATYESMLGDQRQVLERMGAEDARKLVLIGHSMGTTMATRLAHEFSEVRRLLLLGPSFGRITGIRRLLNDDQRGDLQRCGKTRRKGLTINAETMEMMQDDAVFALCRSWDRPADLIHGTRDEFYSSLSVDRVAAEFPVSKVWTVKDADHNFLTKDSRQSVLKCVESICHGWFADHGI